MKLFITGAAGYIGGTFLSAALKKGFKVSGCDNFSNSSNLSIKKLKEMYSFDFYNIDLREFRDISNIINEVAPDVVVHFAALKSVPESNLKQTLYTENNVGGTKNLLDAMRAHGVKKLIFSSSAAVYGEQLEQPVAEDAKISPISHYAKTKAECEKIIRKNCEESSLKAISLRYFNPLGAHLEKIFYDDIYNDERNVLGNIMACYLKLIPYFKVYGDDYRTRDGSALRDYIHIDDLIDGHFSAVNVITDQKNHEIINLGTNSATSVLELVGIFNDVAKTKLPVKIVSRRKSDLSESYADSRKSNKILNWKASKSIEEMCKSCLEIYEN